MKMTSLEKVFMDKIVADSGEPLSVVRNVLRALLVSTLKEVYATYGNSDDKDHINLEYHIPYIAKLDIDCKNVFHKDDGEKTEVKIDVTPSLTLYKEINRIFSDEPLQVEEYYKREIALNILHILDFDKDTIIS